MKEKRIAAYGAVFPTEKRRVVAAPFYPVSVWLGATWHKKKAATKPSPSQQHHQAMERGEDVTMRRHFHPPSSLLPCHRKPHVCYPLTLPSFVYASEPSPLSLLLHIRFYAGEDVPPLYFSQDDRGGRKEDSKISPLTPPLFCRGRQNGITCWGEEKGKGLTLGLQHLWLTPSLLFPSSGVLLGSAIWPEGGGGGRAISFFVGKARHFSTWKNFYFIQTFYFISAAEYFGCGYLGSPPTIRYSRIPFYISSIPLKSHVADITVQYPTPKEKSGKKV